MSQDLTRAGFFKKCMKCGVTWSRRDAFLSDGGIKLIGYQVDFVDLVDGAFLFNHRCGTTLAMAVGDFADLYDGPLFTERKEGTDQCPEYCLYNDNLEPCPVKCECAYVREVMQRIRNWPKNCPDAAGS